MDRWREGWIEGWGDGRMDGQMDRGIDGWVEGWVGGTAALYLRRRSTSPLGAFLALWKLGQKQKEPQEG